MAEMTDAQKELVEMEDRLRQGMDDKTLMERSREGDEALVNQVTGRNPVEKNQVKEPEPQQLPPETEVEKLVREVTDSGAKELPPGIYRKRSEPTPIRPKHSTQTPVQPSKPKAA